MSRDESDARRRSGQQVGGLTSVTAAKFTQPMQRTSEGWRQSDQGTRVSIQAERDDMRAVSGSARRSPRGSGRSVAAAVVAVACTAADSPPTDAWAELEQVDRGSEIKAGVDQEPTFIPGKPSGDQHTASKVTGSGDGASQDCPVKPIGPLEEIQAAVAAARAQAGARRQLSDVRRAGRPSGGHRNRGHRLVPLQRRVRRDQDGRALPRPSTAPLLVCARGRARRGRRRPGHRRGPAAGHPRRGRPPPAVADRADRARRRGSQRLRLRQQPHVLLGRPDAGPVGAGVGHGSRGRHLRHRAGRARSTSSSIPATGTLRSPAPGRARSSTQRPTTRTSRAARTPTSTRRRWRPTGRRSR